MSATRVLVLWMVRGYGRTYGYVIGTELLSWGAGEWATVKWGSVYHALKTLTGAEAAGGLPRRGDGDAARTPPRRGGRPPA